MDENGFFRSWLMLGPLARPGGAAPGESSLLEDYLTDGIVTEATILPWAGDAVMPDFDLAGSTAVNGPMPNGQNPDAPDEAMYLKARALADSGRRAAAAAELRELLRSFPGRTGLCERARGLLALLED